MKGTADVKQDRAARRTSIKAIQGSSRRSSAKGAGESHPVNTRSTRKEVPKGSSVSDAKRAAIIKELSDFWKSDYIEADFSQRVENVILGGFLLSIFMVGAVAGMIFMWAVR